MKTIFFIFTVLFSTLSIAQDSLNVKAETPKIVSKLRFGKLMKIGDVELKFIKVLSDSRCPKGVTCVWAGEAVVLVDIFKDGKKTEQKELTFSPKSHLQNKFSNILKSDELSISSYNILPYPKYGRKITNEEYYLQLEIHN